MKLYGDGMAMLVPATFLGCRVTPNIIVCEAS